MEGKRCSFGTRIAGVPICGEPATVITRSKSAYCRIHYRYIGMRNRAKTRGLYVPTHLELIAITPADGNCPKCGVSMLWEKTEAGERARAASLQHLNGGGVAIWCMGCNSADAHSAVPLDVVLAAPEEHAICCDCRQTLPRSRFHRSKVNRSGVSSYCLECDAVRKRQYREANPEATAARSRRWQEENRDSLQEYHRNHYAANRERRVEYARERRRKIREAKGGAA